MDEYWPKAETAANRAIQLDPNLADGYLAQGALERVRGKLLSADDLFLKALALDPNNPDALNAYMLHLSNVGRLNDAMEVGRQLLALEPYVPKFNSGFSFVLWENGQNDAAIDMLKPVVSGSAVPPAAPQNLAMLYASMGRYAEAADVIDGNAGNLSQPAENLNRTAAGLLRQLPIKRASPQSIPRFRVLSWLHLYVGDPQRALEYYEDSVNSGEIGGSAGDNGFLWHPSYAPVRKTNRFKAYVRSAGLVEYWRVKGWPQWCRPTIGDDFACD